MSPQTTTLDRSIKVTGLSVRTKNALEGDEATARIGGLWGRFFQEGHAARANGRATYSVYSDYASDVNGEYTVVLGFEGEEGEAAAVISAGRYLLFESVGPSSEATIRGWQQVWSFFQQPGAPERAYTADFEEYGPRVPERVRIYVAVR